jgi:hypothetical protein
MRMPELEHLNPHLFESPSTQFTRQENAQNNWRAYYVDIFMRSWLKREKPNPTRHEPDIGVPSALPADGRTRSRMAFDETPTPGLLADLE